MNPATPTIDVVVRCRNEMPYTRGCLDALAAQQGVTARVLFLDCGSTDGSREAAVASGARVLDVDPKTYVPGRVLNLAMRETRSDPVAFVNADAVPRDPGALAALLRPLEENPSLAATYGRQLPRATARPQTVADHARAFGPARPPPLARGAFFSMAASALRRSAWTALPFDERLRYSEDVDLTHRLGALGWGLTYVPEALFEHSHDYELAAQFRRRRGEAQAERLIYHLGEPSVWTHLVRPFVGAVSRDVRAGLWAPTHAVHRAAQALGYYAGRRDAPVSD